jgi:flavin-dependent dehydrogenase
LWRENLKFEEKNMWDVIVVGGGPAGAMAAKKCAELGLETLILEKRKLPREKVCTGMIMSPMAKETIQQEFGEIPVEVLTIPSSLNGIWFHLTGREDERIRVKMPLAWRRDFDYWLIKKALGAGVQVWEEAEVINVAETSREYRVKLKPENQEIEVKAKFIIGADGTASVVRKCLFPQLKVKYVLGYRECHKVDLGLDRNYWHLFSTPEISPYYFSIVHKAEFMLIDLGARAKELEKLVKEARHTLAKNYGFEIGWQPLWRDACLEPVIYHELFSGSFVPAKDNSLLVGDAAGLILPVSGEGIGPALKSGLMAAISVIEASGNNSQASNLYLSELSGLIWKLQELYRYSKKISEEKIKREKVALIKEAWQKAIHMN